MIIPEIKLDGEYDLKILNCPLANDKSVASFIKNIEMEKIKKFTFLGCGRNKNITTLTKHHFKGLEDVEEIIISENDNIESLSSDLFSDMLKLRKVTIEHMKNIFLPENSFETLKKLEYLKLAHLNLSSLNLALFKNMKNLKVLLRIEGKFIDKSRQWHVQRTDDAGRTARQ